MCYFIEKPSFPSCFLFFQNTPTFKWNSNNPSIKNQWRIIYKKKSNRKKSPFSIYIIIIKFNNIKLFPILHIFYTSKNCWVSNIEALYPLTVDDIGKRLFPFGVSIYMDHHHLPLDIHLQMQYQHYYYSIERNERNEIVGLISKSVPAKNIFSLSIST